MVSEDSQRFRWLSEVHRLDDLRDLDETRHAEVPMESHQIDDLRELLEVVSLRGPKWVRAEERDDYIPQVTESVHLVPEQILPMIVLTTVAIDATAAKEPHHLFERFAARLPLDDSERWLNLPSDAHRAIAKDGTAETTFPIDEAHEPSGRVEPFLLVFRTLRIVTAVHAIYPNEGI
jgi:hypothetical protein